MQIIKNIQDIFSDPWSSFINEKVINIQLDKKMIIKNMAIHCQPHLPRTTIVIDTIKIIDKTKKSIINHLNFFISFNIINYFISYFFVIVIC